MRTHEIKLNIEFAEAVLSGEKRFEIRKNDRGYQKGDHVRFTVVGDSITLAQMNDEIQALENMEFEITYVISGWGLENGVIAFGIADVQDKPEIKCDRKWTTLRDRGDIRRSTWRAIEIYLRRNYGIEDPIVDDLGRMTQREVSRIRGIGKITMNEIERAMELYGVKFREVQG